MKTKVRGIYSTALIKMLLDENMEVTQANEAIKKALGIEDESEPDTIVEDMETKDGVYIYGKEPEEIIKILKKHLKYCIFYKEEIGRIYCGIIKNTDQKSKSIIISLPDDEEGVLDLKNFWGYVKPGSKILVQSKGTYDGKIMLSTQLRIFGENVIIIKNGFTKMSRGIHSHEGRNKLYELAKDLDMKDWGILWVQGAETKDEAVLKEELTSLQSKEAEISEKFSKCDKPEVLYEGVSKYFVILSKADKEYLDKVRRKVMPTIPEHHVLKSGGYTILTDFAENLLDKHSEDEIKKKIDQTLLRYGPLEGRAYSLVFTRLNGTSYKVDGLLENVEFKHDMAVKLRVVNKNDWGERIYEIDADKRYIVMHRGETDEITMTFMPQIFPKFAKITTFDVSAKKENGETSVINEERLEKLVKKGEITNELEEELKKVLEEIKKYEP